MLDPVKLTVSINRDDTLIFIFIKLHFAKMFTLVTQKLTEEPSTKAHNI